MDDVLTHLQSYYSQHTIEYFQSNFEGEIIGKIQENDFDALIINPGAFTHYSYAIADALKNLRKPKIS